MVDIKPFRGVRPRPDMIKLVASPPYDVLNSDEARQMASENRHSFLHVVKAEIDLPEDVDVHSEEVYRLSAANFLKMRDEGVFTVDDTPCFYVYQLKMGDRVQKGLVVGASVDDYETGRIKKHELTRREKEDDRARHVEIIRAHAGPVLFTHKANDQVREIVQRVSFHSQPVYDFQADDGVSHTLWVISDGAVIEQLQEAFKNVDALYVADGHHRTASAYRVRDIMRAKNPHHTGDEEYNYFLAVLFADDELKIMGYNRVIRDLNGLSKEELLRRISDSFEVETTTTAQPSASRQFGMYLDGQWYRLTAKDTVYPADDPVRSLDVAILQESLLSPLLGIEDPRTDTRIDFVGGIRGTEALERRCAEDMQIAFALAPVTVAQLMAIADKDAIMPPKSTWFEPKLRSGVVVHEF